MSSASKVDVSGWTDVLLLLCCQEMTRLKGLITQLNNDMEVSQVMMLRCVSAMCMSTEPVLLLMIRHTGGIWVCAHVSVSLSLCV